MSTKSEKPFFHSNRVRRAILHTWFRNRIETFFLFIIHSPMFVILFVHRHQEIENMRKQRRSKIPISYEWLAINALRLLNVKRESVGSFALGANRDSWEYYVSKKIAEMHNSLYILNKRNSKHISDMRINEMQFHDIIVCFYVYSVGFKKIWSWYIRFSAIKREWNQTIFLYKFVFRIFACRNQFINIHYTHTLTKRVGRWNKVIKICEKLSKTSCSLQTFDTINKWNLCIPISIRANEHNYLFN